MKRHFTNMPYLDQREPAAHQLLEFKKKHQDDEARVTTNSGDPESYNNASLTVGKRGVILFQDYYLYDELAYFARERIPERVVHAKAAGAFGYFELTHDISQYSAAKVFNGIGKRTPIAVRFSQVAGEMGSADTVRDVRGFAMKFYTEDGIWDLVGNNTPIFFVRDAIVFPSFIRILKRNPVTHLHDYDMFWDFITLRPESTHQTMVLFSDRGIPASYRNMHGYGSNTYSLINEQGAVVYCKFHYLTDQGIRNLRSDKATIIAGVDPDYYIRDLYNSIAKNDYPTWTFYIQVMTPEQAEKYDYNPFDVTKVWLHADFPLIPVGKFVLNKNPTNYFAEVEQMAFAVSNLVPGIDVSPDRMLQARVFSYPDAHRYRLSVNNELIPVNRSLSQVTSYGRDGKMRVDNNMDGAPNYHPNSFGGPGFDLRAKQLTPILPVVGNAARYDNGDEDNFRQARLLYQRVLKPDERGRLIGNIVDHLKNASAFLHERAVDMFSQVDDDFGKRIQQGLLDSIQTHVSL